MRYSWPPGPLGGQEYLIYDLHIGLAVQLGRSRFAVFRTAEGAQGAELGQGHIFQDIDEVVFIQ